MRARGGGDDRLSGEEFSAELQDADRTVSAAFERVFATIGDAGEGETVPEPTREAAVEAAETEREAADDLDELTPPEDAEEATDELVDQARAQADAIEEAASRDDVTVAELAETPSRSRTPMRRSPSFATSGTLPVRTSRVAGK